MLRYRTTFFSFYGWISNLGQKNKIAKFSDYIAAYDKWDFQLYYNRAQSYAVQTQAILSVGLSYTFQNKPKPKK